MGRKDKSATPVRRLDFCQVQVLFDPSAAFFDLKTDEALITTAEPSIGCSHTIAGSLCFFGCVKPCLKISKTPRRGRRRGPEGLMCSAEKFNLCHECQHPSRWTHEREKRSIITISGERSSVSLNITYFTTNADTDNKPIKNENAQVQVQVW